MGGYSMKITPVFPFQYHSINATNPSSSTCFSYQQHKRAKPGTLPKSKVLSVIWEQWLQEYFRSFKVFKRRATILAVSLHPLTAETSVWLAGILCRICGEKCGSGKGLSLRKFDIPQSIYF